MSCTTCQNSNLCGCPITLSDLCVRYENDKRLENINVNPSVKLRDILINIDKKIGEIELASSGQELTFNPLNNNLTISNGNTVVIPVGENNVKSDWNETDSNSDSFILNKPTIPSNQTLSINGSDLTISGGNTVTLPSGSGSSDFLTNVAQNTIIGRVSVGEGNSEELTATQVRTIINVEDGAQVNPSGAELESSLDTELANLRWKAVEVPSGGTTGQVLKKNTNTDYDYSWANDDTGGGGSLPSGVLDDLLYHNGTSFVKATPVVYKTTGLTGTTITLPSTPLTTNEFYLDVVINTARIQGASPYDYTISGNTITTNFTLVASDNIRVKYIIA